jgi:hypothetical protein
MIQENQLYTIQSKLNNKVLTVLSSSESPNHPKLTNYNNDETQKFVIEK